MIQKLSFGVFEVTCDECGYEESFDVDDDWNDLLSEMKENGWQNRYSGGGNYSHFCSDCS